MIAKVIASVESLFSQRPNLRKVLFNSGWLIADKLLRLALGLFITALVARHLGPTQYGKLAYAIAFIAIFQSIASLGLDSIVVRDISQDERNAHLFLGTALRLRLISSTASFLISGLAAYALFPEDAETALLVGLLGLGMVFQASDVIDLWFQSQSQSRRTVAAKACSYLVSSVVKILLVHANAPLWTFAAIVGTETALSAAALAYAYRKYPHPQGWVWAAPVARRLLRYGLPLFLSGISITIYMKSSQLIIRQLLDSASLGIYSTAQLISELWYFLPMTIITSVAPTIAHKKIASEHDYNSALANIFAAMWLMSMAISAGIALCSGLIIQILFGSTYAGAAPVLAIHIFTLIPVCIGVTQSLWLVNENRMALALYQAGVGAVSSIGLNFLLVSNFGVIGGALATVLSQFIQAFLVNAFLAPKLFEMQIQSLLYAFTLVWKAVSKVWTRITH